MELRAAVFGAGTSIWDAERIRSLQPLQAKIFTDTIDAMGALSAEVKLYSVDTVKRLHLAVQLLTCFPDVASNS
jgi:hypothetical protein